VSGRNASASAVPGPHGGPHVVSASPRVRNLPQGVSHLGEKWLDQPVRLWYHMLTWSHRVRRRPVPMRVCQPRQIRGRKRSCPCSRTLDSSMEFRWARTQAPAYGVPLQSCRWAGRR
jgi:hypothetical protein